MSPRQDWEPLRGERAIQSGRKQQGLDLDVGRKPRQIYGGSWVLPWICDSWEYIVRYWKERSETRNCPDSQTFIQHVMDIKSVLVIRASHVLGCCREAGMGRRLMWRGLRREVVVGLGEEEEGKWLWWGTIFWWNAWL